MSKTHAGGNGPESTPTSPDPGSTQPLGSATGARTASNWRVVDIVVASVLAVAVGVIFWLWSAGYAGISIITAAFPPLGGLYGGGWLIAGVIGGLVIRKPGAALYCEIIAALVEALLGSHFGLTVLLSGLVQGIGAELAFAVFRYRKFTLPIALLAGAMAGVAMGILDNLGYNAEWDVAWKTVYLVFGAVSGALIAGLLSWLAVRGLAKTGALANLASRRAAAESAF
ncbi:ECF transporter S component [Paenarthrobacter sp. PH39-S1]|uniref:ECF transporter S component n=1 Tax=Paenarthrobacter sp. PH39-S1 TaxID=3046204 RepID=UPI0024B91BD7|nr:ECF transporter S component [Paenarthrobacter sp. PH39-S1]MDJ0354768.1 ECF transporter S component [Paenarthrobacter sp. PH39-S1]